MQPVEMRLKVSESSAPKVSGALVYNQYTLMKWALNVT